MSSLCPISVLLPTRNEAANIRRCLTALRGWADEIVVVDSRSVDETAEIAAAFGARILQFQYKGGWPKKRQWALENYQWRNEWILLLDADEILLEPIKNEIRAAIRTADINGFWLSLDMIFLGTKLRFGDTRLQKLSLIRRGKGCYEKRLEDQDDSMCDMEVHEHMVVDGRVGRLRETIWHENTNNLSHYIQKHNAYSTWESRTLLANLDSPIKPRLFGNQAERRRWLKRRLLRLPGSQFLYFLYTYVLRLGILDGRAGLIYATFRSIQMVHVKAKMYELHRGEQLAESARLSVRKNGGEFTESDANKSEKLVR